jgi:hypothetical protein
MDFDQVRNVAALPFVGPTFSVCTLVTRAEQYGRMLQSFKARGLGADNAEFIIVDNRQGNSFDAYNDLNTLMATARGRYIICCHQDVELIGHGAVELEAKLEELSASDPKWAVAGNAAIGPHGAAFRISDPSGENQNSGIFPSLVYSLDENFLVFRAEARTGLSVDLGGFHLYGTDACLQAELRGLKDYVIDFHLRHHSPGIVEASYFECLRRREENYSAAFRSRRLRASIKTAYNTSSYWRVLWWKMKKRRRARLDARRITR